MKNNQRPFFVFQGKMRVEVLSDRAAASQLKRHQDAGREERTLLAGRLKIYKVRRFTPLNHRALRAHCNGQTRREEYAKSGTHTYLAPTFQIRLDKRKRSCRVEYLKWDSRLLHEVRLLIRWIMKSAHLDQGCVYFPGILLGSDDGGGVAFTGQQECGILDALPRVSAFGRGRPGSYGFIMNPKSKQITALPFPGVCKYESSRVYAEALEKTKQKEGEKSPRFSRRIVFVQSWNRPDSHLGSLSRREGVLKLDELNRRAYEYFFPSQRERLLERYQGMRQLRFFQLNLGTDSVKAATLLSRFLREGKK